MSDPSSRPVRAVVLGPPGSGKGTQAERLSASMGIPAISTGELLRREVARETPLGKDVAATLASGRLVEDSVMEGLVRDRLREDDARGGFLLDGFPRTIEQAEALGRMLEEEGLALDVVLQLDVSEDVLVRRALARKRADDREDVIRRRLRLYREKTEPLIEHYESQGLLRRIDGEAPIKAITARLMTLLREVA